MGCSMGVGGHDTARNAASSSERDGKPETNMNAASTTNVYTSTLVSVVDLLRSVRERCKREGVKVPAAGQAK